MTHQEFSVHLTHLTPQIKKLIASARRKRFFGDFDADDIMQEVMMTLWMKIPRSYDESRGELKNYCIKSAYNCIKRIISRQYKKRLEVCVDWQEDFEHSTSCESQLSKSEHMQLVQMMKVNSKEHSVLFRILLSQLSRHDNDFKIVEQLLKFDCNRQRVCKSLKRSNASLTKLFKRIRERCRNVLIVDPLDAYIKNGVNVFVN